MQQRQLALSGASSACNDSPHLVRQLQHVLDVCPAQHAARVGGRRRLVGSRAGRLASVALSTLYLCAQPTPPPLPTHLLLLLLLLRLAAAAACQIAILVLPPRITILAVISRRPWALTALRRSAAILGPRTAALAPVCRVGSTAHTYVADAAQHRQPAANTCCQLLFEQCRHFPVRTCT